MRLFSPITTVGRLGTCRKNATDPGGSICRAGGRRTRWFADCHSGLTGLYQFSSSDLFQRRHGAGTGSYWKAGHADNGLETDTHKIAGWGIATRNDHSRTLEKDAPGENPDVPCRVFRTPARFDCHGFPGFHVSRRAYVSLRSSHSRRTPPLSAITLAPWRNVPVRTMSRLHVVGEVLQNDRRPRTCASRCCDNSVPPMSFLWAPNMCSSRARTFEPVVLTRFSRSLIDLLRYPLRRIRLFRPFSFKLRRWDRLPIL